MLLHNQTSVFGTTWTYINPVLGPTFATSASGVTPVNGTYMANASTNAIAYYASGFPNLFPSSGPFTIEFYFWPVSDGSSRVRNVMTFGSNTTANYWNIRYNSQPPSGTVVAHVDNFGIYRNNTSGSTGNVQQTGNGEVYFRTAQWHHVAVVRNNSNQFRIYVDGVDRSTATPISFVGATDISSNTALQLFAGSSGYYDLMRISTTARYTSGFTPSTTYGADSSTWFFSSFENSWQPTPITV